MLQLKWGMAEDNICCDAALMLCTNEGRVSGIQKSLPEEIQKELSIQLKGNNKKGPFVFPTLGYMSERLIIFIKMNLHEGKQAEKIAEICEEYKCKTLRVYLSEDFSEEKPDLARLMAMEIILGSFRLEKGMESHCWCQVNGLDGEQERAVNIGHMVNDMRKLVNFPANFLTPERMAQMVYQIAEEREEYCQIIRKEQLEKEGYGAILAVGSGSKNLPCLVILRHLNGGKDAPVLGLIGKGITFDSGGLCIKGSSDMAEMISDMEGAAAVLGAWKHIHDEKCSVNLIAVLALAENMPDGKAFRPGDIIKTASGKTVEIINTDAEGRLVLADGITAAIRAGATHLIDVATLTGAARIALGREAIACITNNEAFFKDLERVSHRMEERLWLMPSYEEYEEQLCSQVADLKNIGDGKGAGMQVAGLFLKSFTEGLPWVHLDIGGCAAPDSKRMGFYVPSTRTLAEFAYCWKDKRTT